MFMLDFNYQYGLYHISFCTDIIGTVTCFLCFQFRSI